MTLELNKVTGQIDDMGRVLAERGEAAAQDLARCPRVAASAMPTTRNELRAVAESAAGTASCAVPARRRAAGRRLSRAEPARARSPSSPPTARRSIPTSTAGPSTMLINVGSIVYRHGSGQAPSAASAPAAVLPGAVYPEGNPLSRRPDQRRARPGRDAGAGRPGPGASRPAGRLRGPGGRHRS